MTKYFCYDTNPLHTERRDLIVIEFGHITCRVSVTPDHTGEMYLISSVLTILTILSGSSAGTSKLLAREEDGDLLNEQFIDMNQENMKIFAPRSEKSIYVDEDNLEKELAESEKSKLSLTRQVVVISSVLSAALLLGSCILLILCRKSRLSYRRREEDAGANSVP